MICDRVRYAVVLSSWFWAARTSWCGFVHDMWMSSPFGQGERVKTYGPYLRWGLGRIDEHFMVVPARTAPKHLSWHV